MTAELDLVALRTAVIDLAESAFDAACDDNIDYTRAQNTLVAALRKFQSVTGLIPDLEEGLAEDWGDR